MAFPDTQLPVIVELDLAGDGSFSTDLTAARKVRVPSGITITRGRSNETDTAGPSSCRLVADNRDGSLSPRNPTGDYYGQLRRNTPIRVSITKDTSHLQVDAATGTTPAAGARVTAPDSSPLSITGDIDLRFDADLDAWRSTSMDLVGKWTSTAGQKSYQLVLLSSGRIGIYWSPDGTTELGIDSNAPVPIQHGRIAVRATLDVDNGSGGRTATFYIAPTLAGPWTQLGDALAASGTTSIFDSTTVATVLDTATGSQGNIIRGKVYGAEIRNGIGGTLVAAPDFTVQADGATSFIDQAPGALTGEQAVADGAAATADYLVCDDADAADITVGDFVVLTNSADVLKESTVFTVTSKVSAFGFTNIFYSPNSSAVTTTGDKMKVVGNTWTLTGEVSLTTRDVRFTGEVPSWPVSWDVSQRDVQTPIEAAGVMRRLQTGAPRLGSTVYRAMTSLTNVVAYWPMEDGTDATEFGSAVGGPPMRYTGTAPQFATYDGFDCSDPIATLDNLTDLRGAVPRYTPTGECQVRGLINVPAAGLTTNSEIISVNFGPMHFQVRYTTGTAGSLTLRAFDGDGTSLLTDGPWDFSVNGKDLLLSIELTQDGADIDYALATWEVQDNEAGLVITGTVAGQTLGRCTRVQWNTNGGVGDGLSVGHTVVQSEVTGLFDRGDELRGFRGESAYDRIARLCAENGVAFAGVGTQSSTEMGPQKSGELMDLLREAEAADGGILYEARDQLAIGYRTRRSLHTQEPTLTLDYAGRHLSQLQPVEDDDATRNDITVTRIDGSSARSTLETGAMSVQAPPDGIGRYGADYRLSLEDDGYLLQHAAWRMAVGTVDEARYPQIAVNLAARAIASSTTLTAAVRDLDVGDRLVVENPPAWLPPEDISQLAVGFTEIIGPKQHTITANNTPEAPYRVGVFSGQTGAAESRYNCAGTVTAEALDTTETGVDITIPAGKRGWGHGSGDYPVVIGGEEMTVIGVSGTAPSQTLTVVRSVNGVVKSHAAGASVQLARPVRYGLL